MAVEDLMKSISESLRLSANSDAVFGESRTIGEKTIIPVARVKTGFGAGGCAMGADEEQECRGNGGGGGGMALPVAVIEVTSGQTRVIPVVDVTRIALGSLCALGIVTWMVTKVCGRCRS